jgi:hypothetical protein
MQQTINIEIEWNTPHQSYETISIRPVLFTRRELVLKSDFRTHLTEDMKKLIYVNYLQVVLNNLKSSSK